jgi:hypothetical protein
MSQTPCKRCGFPLPIRWPRAGGNLAQPNVPGSRVDTLQHLPKGPLHPTDLPYLQTNSSNPVSVTPIIELGARIKSS